MQQIYENYNSQIPHIGSWHQLVFIFLDGTFNAHS